MNMLIFFFLLISSGQMSLVIEEKWEGAKSREKNARTPFRQHILDVDSDVKFFIMYPSLKNWGIAQKSPGLISETNPNN